MAHMDPVQSVKSKLSIEEVVSPYLTMKKAGRHFKALCPFHQEKTASFYISPDRQLAYCFSCRKGGDMFQFIQEIEGLDFKGALELLADRAHVDLSKFDLKKGPSRDQKDRLHDIHHAANNFFVQSLWNTQEGEKVLAYLRQRGLTDETLKHFSVGFAPDRKDALYRQLLEKDYSKVDLLSSTLVMARDSGQERIEDRFQLRLMIPIFDGQGRPIAFGGRVLRKGDQPKYLNSPEHALYQKSHVLYNMHHAKKPIREQDLAVVVEGYFDVMASAQAGVPHVVASCGTALTEPQFKLLKRYCQRVALAFDADAAGQAALLRAIELAQPLGIELYVVEVPEGKDAADAVKEDPELWKKAVEERESYMDYFLRSYQDRYDLKTLTGKKHYADAVLNLLKGVVHPVERDHYLNLLSGQLGTPVAQLYDHLNGLKSGQSRVQRKQGGLDEPQETLRQRLVRQFLALLLAYPEAFFEHYESYKNLDDFKSRVKELGLNQPLNRLTEEEFLPFVSDLAVSLKAYDEFYEASSVYKEVLAQYNSGAEPDNEALNNSKWGAELRQAAFEAEVRNVDPKMIAQEFDKLMVLLYLRRSQ